MASFPSCRGGVLSKIGYSSPFPGKEKGREGGLLNGDWDRDPLGSGLAPGKGGPAVEKGISKGPFRGGVDHPLLLSGRKGTGRPLMEGRGGGGGGL